MPIEPYKAKIREFEVEVDINFEERIGVYGKAFWGGISSGLYETETFDFINRQSTSGSKVLIDVGSATGCMALYAAALNMHVVATEPQNLVYEALTRNIKLNPQLALRIKALHCLVGSTKKNSKSEEVYFTPGANGPLEKEIDAEVVTLESLLVNFTIQDKVSLKVDIEGAEYPLLSDSLILNCLKEKKVTMYLSFHPGFSRKLSSSPSHLELLTWRTFTLIDTVTFVKKIKKYASISSLNLQKEMGLLTVIRNLVRGQKDYVLKF